FVSFGPHDHQHRRGTLLDAVVPALLVFVDSRRARRLFANLFVGALAEWRHRHNLFGRGRDIFYSGGAGIDLALGRQKMGPANFCTTPEFGSSSGGMSKTRAVWFFIAALTLIRLSLLGSTDLEFDEAHYWLWSDTLAPGYFSKGPGIAFAIRASTAIFGPTEFGVRFWSPILAAGTSLFLFYFGRRLFSENVGLWTVIAFNVAPIFNVGAFVMTTDALSIFFWTVAMFTFWLAVEKSPQFSFYWPLTGFLIGLGFLSRYTNAFEVVCVLLVLAFAPRLRQEFKRPGLYWLLGCFVICTIPPIVWNAQHAWITVLHLRTRGSLTEDVGF